MAAAAAADDDDDEAWEPPLLSWKGIQSWSVGCRAPAICEIFVGLKSKKLSKLISTDPKTKKGKRRKRREGEDGIRPVQQLGGANGSPSSLTSASLQPLPCHTIDEETPKRHSSFNERCLSGRIINQLRRNSDAAIGNLRRNSHPSACNPGRNSDASAACNLQRFSTSSSASCGGYERVWVLEGGNGGGGVDHMLPREVKLGGRRSDASAAPLGRQDSQVSAHRHSCSSFSSYSSSAASSVGNLTRRRSSGGGGGREGEQRHLSELLGGNQYLTHLTAAPVPGNCGGKPQMRPSEGLLLGASVRCREAELKDRIIFFL
eukprot:c15472_g1_i1 orf=115-1068(-)